MNEEASPILKTSVFLNKLFNTSRNPNNVAKEQTVQPTMGDFENPTSISTSESMKETVEVVKMTTTELETVPKDSSTTEMKDKNLSESK